MTFTKQSQNHTKKSKPFLVLSVIQTDLSEETEILPKMPVKNTGLNLFIKTWPPKLKNKTNKEREEKKRPLTATLEKPLILDVRLAKKIDMSKIRKEFLNISTICRIPISLKSKKTLRPLSLPPPEKKKSRKKKMTDTEDNCEDEESVSIKSTSRSRSIKSEAALIPDKTNANTTKIAKPCDANNNTKPIHSYGTYRIARKQCHQRHPLPINFNKSSASSAKTERNRAKSDMIAKNESNNTLNSNNNHLNKSTKHGLVVMSNASQKSIIAVVPEPCKTCGRTNQPERLHSHPEVNFRNSNAVRTVVKNMEEVPKIPVKSTVQKPVAIKYKSKSKNEPNNLTFRKPTSNLKKMPPTILPESKLPEPVPLQKIPEVTPNRIRSAKRMLTCYLCGREFGSASLPIHEPKCLEKWNRENSSLPSHLRRKPPPKPDHSLSQEEWNKSAWEAAQSTLVPCKNCGRTFYPDRLIVHQRSCKTPVQNKNQTNQHSDHHFMSSSSSAPMTDSSAPSTPSSIGRPPAIECYICGKLFGSKSIKIHETQCLKKWSLENESLPRDMQSPPPIRTHQQVKNRSNASILVQPKTPEQASQPHSSTHKQSDSDDRPQSSRKPPLFPCYLCGKLFTVNSIYIHEPQCLKMWKIENDKLPAHKRRPQPLKPEIKFTRDGKVDVEATADEMWQVHLSQLVPCRMCSRTFNPDRVEVHERSCKGL